MSRTQREKCVIACFVLTVVSVCLCLPTTIISVQDFSNRSTSPTAYPYSVQAVFENVQYYIWIPSVFTFLIAFLCLFGSILHFVMAILALPTIVVQSFVMILVLSPSVNKVIEQVGKDGNSLFSAITQIDPKTHCMYAGSIMLLLSTFLIVFGIFLPNDDTEKRVYYSYAADGSATPLADPYGPRAVRK